MKYRPQESEDGIVLTPETPAGASVIWLHGLGADGYDFVPIVSELGLPAEAAVRFVFPHAPVRAVTINNGMRMRAWYDIAGVDIGAREDAAGVRESAATVERLIQRERETGLAGNRIVIAGFSQGGAIALHAGLRHAEALAGVLALSTYLPLRGELAQAASANRSTPILMCHGRFDPIIPYAVGEGSRDLLRAHGYAVEWRGYDMQHEVCRAEIAAIGAWLAERYGAASARSSSSAK